MSAQLNQGPRPLAHSAVAAPPPAAGRPAAQRQPAPVAERDTSVRLSAQGVAGAALEAGKASVDVAHDFMQRMAQAVFGDAADGARFDFDAVSLDSSASFAAAGAYASGPDGTASSAAIALTESAHFIGKGQLTLENGQTYDFEVEVKYEASVQASSVQVETPDVILTGKELPAIKYPGGIEDLFKLLGRELSTDQGDPGKLTLRLMRLVDRAALLAPRLADEAPAAQKNAANAYAIAADV